MGSATETKCAASLTLSTTWPIVEVENIALDQDHGEAESNGSDTSKPSWAGLQVGDGRTGQLTYMRIYQGKVARHSIVNCSADSGR